MRFGGGGVLVMAARLYKINCYIHIYDGVVVGVLYTKYRFAGYVT